METNNNSTSRIHPLIAAAAVAVLLVCLVGVAAMTGMLPNSNSTGSQKEAIAALEKDASDKAAAAQAAADKANQARQEADERQAAAIKAENQAKAQTKAYNAPKLAQAAPVCSNCGRIESIRSVQVAAKPSGVGVVGGAVVGGLLGNQIGNGNGRSLATVAGAVGGGFAGNEIEKRTRTTTAYEVRVRMEDGRIRTFPFHNPPNWNTGDSVRVVDGYLRAR